MTAPTNEHTNISTHIPETDDEVLSVYKRVTSFDDTIDKALGKFSKQNKKISTFGRPHRNYSFIRVPSFDNVLLPVFKSGFLSHHESLSLGTVHPLYQHLYIYLLIVLSTSLIVR